MYKHNTSVIIPINLTVILKNDIMSGFHHLSWVNLDLFHTEVKFLTGPMVPFEVFWGHWFCLRGLLI